MKSKIKFYTFFLLLICSCSYGQIEKYNFKRELKNTKEEWQRLILPQDVFKKVADDFSDIRIYGITPNHDTIEAPYLLRLATEKISEKEIECKIINSVSNEKGFYFTFEIPASETINQIRPEFNLQNFDWKIKLEAGNDQKEWFTVLEDYRILSIKNDRSDLQFTDIIFPNSSYHFFRLFIPGKEKVQLLSAKTLEYERKDGTYNNYDVKELKSFNKNKQTEINIDLGAAVPLSYLKINVKDNFDYYRPVTIEYLADSFKTEQGWKYNYTSLSSGTLNSIEKNEFKFNSTILQKLKVIVQNNDNQPLNIANIDAKGYVHELIIRFNKPADYFLVYGNRDAAIPQYDINQFSEKIPENLAAVEIGKEQLINKEILPESVPLFKNKIWLWLIIILIIGLLGVFSVSMMRKK